MRRFIKPASAQFDASFFKPLAHHLLRDFSLTGLLLPTSSPTPSSSRLSPRHHPSCTMHRRVKRKRTFLRFDSFQNHRIFTHRASDKTALTGKSRSGSFSNDPEIDSAMFLQPRIIVMVVNFLENVSAKDLCDPRRDPIPSGIRIAAS